MSIDASLRTAGGIANHRNVLTRAERVAKLAENGKFDTESGDPLGLPKVGNVRVVAGKGKKKGPAASE